MLQDFLFALRTLGGISWSFAVTARQDGTDLILTQPVPHRARERRLVEGYEPVPEVAIDPYQLVDHLVVGRERSRVVDQDRLVVSASGRRMRLPVNGCRASMYHRDPRL